MESKFSINITDNLNDWELAFELLQNKYFRGIELPACHLNNPKLPNLLEKSNIKITNLANLVPTSLTRNITEQSTKVQKNVFEHIDSILNKKYDFPFDCFSLDMGLDLRLDNKELTQLKINFLKQFINTLFSNKMFMTLPVRIPYHIPINEFSQQILEIIRSTMFNRFKICLNIYPHKIIKDAVPEKIYNWYEFDLKTVRIVYEPETGNYLTEKLLEHWIKPLEELDFKGNIIFCPRTNSFSFFENEINNLNTLIGKIAKKPNC